MIYLAWLGIFAALTFLGYRSHKHNTRTRGATAKKDPFLGLGTSSQAKISPDWDV
jgi:hypothetical protein